MMAQTKVDPAECYKPRSDWTYMTFEECLAGKGAEITRFNKK